jgi:hypothetical protein
MTTTKQSRVVHRGKPYGRKLKDGTTLAGEISPCVFMYPGYPLQVQVTLTGKAGENLGNAIIANRRLSINTATEADVRELLANVRTQSCSGCENVVFDPTTVETNRNGLCEGCFLGNLEAQWAKESETEFRMTARHRQAMKAKGMKFHIIGWIHPDAGDDYQVDWFFQKRPTKAAIRALLREEGSTVLDDFQIIAI